jgi:hypothetical protein
VTRDKPLWVKAVLQTVALGATFKAAILIVQHIHHLTGYVGWVSLLLVLGLVADLGARLS